MKKFLMTEIIMSHVKLWTSEERFKECCRTWNLKTAGARMGILGILFSFSLKTWGLMCMNHFNNAVTAEDIQHWIIWEDAQQ